MFAITTHIEGKDRFVRDDSRGGTLWSTLDRGRAMTFDAIADAMAWAFDLPEDPFDRLLSRRAEVVNLETGEWATIPDRTVPAFIDDASLSVSAIEYERMVSEYRRP